MFFPETEMFLGGWGVEFWMGLVEVRVQVLLSVFKEVAPYWDCIFVYVVCFDLDLAIWEESAVEISLGELGEILKISEIELEICGVLVEKLRDAV